MNPEKIVVIPHSLENKTIDWVIFSAENQLIEHRLNEHIQQLHAVAKNKSILCVLPAQDVLLTSVTLPKLNRQKLQQALPYALEEQLIDDVSTLHFVSGPYLENGTYPVAVIAKNIMQNWLGFFRSYQLEPALFVPLTLAIPYEQDQLIAYDYQQQIILRTDKYSGIATHASSLDFLIKNITYCQLPPKEMLQKIAIQMTNEAPFNLLQHPFSAKKHFISRKNCWKLTSYLLMILIGLQFFSQIFSFVILHHQSTSVNQAINTIYHHYFPQASAVTAPHERLNSKITELTRAKNKNNFLVLLGTVSKIFHETHGLHLQRLDYRNGILTLEISTLNFDEIDMLIQKLLQQSLSVKQQNITTVGSEVKATLLINAGTI